MAIVPGPSIGTAPLPSVGTVPGPSTPGSLGLATLHHTLLAADIDLDSGVPLDVGTTFPTGTKTIFVMLAWDRTPADTKLGIRLLQDGT